MSNVPLLVGISGTASGQRHPVPPQGLRIGRQAGNEVVLDENGISRQHARLIFHNGALWVQDMGSRNGVFVNDARVQAHRQLSIGDRVRVGSSVFEVVLDEPSNDLSVSVAAPRPPARRGFKPLPFVLAAVVVLALVAMVAWAGARQRVKVADRREGDVEIATLLGTSAGAGAGEAGTAVQPGTEPGVSADANLMDLFNGGSSGTQPVMPTEVAPDIDENWPDPPPGMTSRELVEKAHSLYNADHLHDALVAYHQAQALDPSCEICARRIDRLNSDITARISEYFDTGLRYFNDMQYQQAINSWEMVLLLSPNPNSRSNQRAKEYLANARSKMSSQY
ncbi:MAG: FHA domain-containing protein [Pseudomonadota bacterium]